MSFDKPTQLSILAFFHYWQHILYKRAVTYNKKAHADDGLLIICSSDNINTFSQGADKPGIFPRTVHFNQVERNHNTSVS